MHVIKLLNMGLVFSLELAMLAAFVYWGFHMQATTWVRVTAGLLTPAVVIVLWSIFAAPLSSLRLKQPWLAVFELTAFLLAAAALYISDAVTWAYALAGLAVISVAIELYARQ